MTDTYASNPSLLLSAVDLAQQLDQRPVYDLGRPLMAGMPQSPNHPEFRHALQRRHGDVMRSDGSSAANDLLVMGTHVGTHIDALSHVSYQDRLYGDISATEAQLGGRFSALGAETIEPMICRGLLLDIPAVKGVTNCEPAYEVTPADLDKALALTSTDTRPGDVLIIRTGWGQFYDLREKYQGLEAGVPGPAEPAARWISSRQPRAVGSDTIAFECIPPRRGHAHLPVHRHLLVEAGIYIVECLDLEELAQAKGNVFLFILSSLKLVGATGSPVRPLAIPLDGVPA